MAIKSLVEIQSDLSGERINGKPKDSSPSVSIWTLLRDVIDSFDSIVETKINDNMSIVEILSETIEMETHIHSYGRWMEKAAVPNGEIHVADRIGSGGGAFQIDAGNDDWGTWVQILGSNDTPIQTGKVKFDLHRIIIEASERNETYFIQIGFGDSGAAALIADDITETVLEPLSNQVDSAPIIIQDKRSDSGIKVWVRCMCPGQNTATVDFYIGFHEYDE